ncbi:MAG: gliding motility-associated C-terminal domain-containing protein [Ferruginibacter sp.]
MPKLFAGLIANKILFIKYAALFMITVLLHCMALGQKPTGDFMKAIDSLVRINQLNHRSFENPHAPFERRVATSKQSKAGFNVPSLSRPAGIGSCIDTSSKVSLDKDSVHFYVAVSAKTNDGNVLLSGEYYNFWDTVSQSKGFLMKCDLYGNVIWAKLYDSTGHKLYHYINNYRLIELMDGSILMAGIAPDGESGNDDMILTRTDANGNIIWVKDYYSLAWGRGHGSADYFYIFELKQDRADGSVYISSSAWGEGVYVIKVNVSDGSIPWSNVYRLYTNGYGFQSSGGVAIRLNDLVAFSTVSPYNSTLVLMYRINKATGDTFNTRLLSLLDTPYYKKGFIRFQSMEQLVNGNIALAGPLYGYYQYQYDGIDPLYQVGVIELDANLDFAKGYVFRNNIENNFSNTRITVHADGSGLFNMLKTKSGYSADQYFVQFKNGIILKERKRQASNEGYPAENPTLQIANGGELLIQLVGDSITNSSRVLFTKLHLSDTSSDCLGYEINNTFVEPIHYGDPQPAFMDSTRHFVMQERNVRTLTATPLLMTAPKPACYQIANCDTLVLRASADTICPQLPFYITTRKNKACGSKVQFTYDTAAVQSFMPVNDSVYQVIFKRAWKGFIFGSVAGCNLHIDSVPVTVLVAPPVLNLGPDTVLCPGNQIILNARTGYAAYRWQNGSTDSLFTITQPGQYFVITTNACGDSFRDTVIVAPHPPIPFNIGADTSICQNQSIAIQAPAGFISYFWSGATVNNSSMQSITVAPQASGWYKVTAAQTPGCFASDSLYLTVKQIPVISIGNDTSLCAGQQLLLNAGTMFDSYAWSTGQQSSQIFVNQPGLYSVAATFNGCTAYDTLQVWAVNPLPVFNLGKDTTLCLGQTLSLSVMLPQATYQWNNQNSSSSFNIIQAGTYWLRVTQQGCSATDTIVVSYVNAPVFDLGKDTSLCQGQLILLNALSAGASYFWQDGSTASSFTVSSSGLYKVIASIGQCSTADSILVTFIPVPLFNLGSDKFLCTGQQVVLAPTLNTTARLRWQDGSIAATYTVTKAGTYSLQAINFCGVAIDTIRIIMGSCIIQMFSAFSPNGDGNNDVFRVKYPFAMPQFRMVVFNRYGEKIFETNNINEGWDGTWKSEPQPPGSYVWVINYTDSDKVQRKLQGTVIVLR